MLFLAISTPRAEEPSRMKSRRQRYWRWIAPLQKSGAVRWVYARTGRGAVVLFDVDSNETLHRLLNEWGEIIPAVFDIYPLIDAIAAKQFLKRQANARPSGRKRQIRSVVAAAEFG